MQKQFIMRHTKPCSTTGIFMQAPFYRWQTRSQLPWGAFLLLCALGFPNAHAVSCVLSSSGDEIVAVIAENRDSLEGTWKELGSFKVRLVLSAPANKPAWLLIEVFGGATDGDMRILSSHTVYSPFQTGRLEVVEPKLGRSLSYQCGGPE